MNSPKSLWFILVFGLLFTGLKAQEKNIRDSVITMSMLHVDYAPFVPGGDLASRFGTTHTIGGAFGRKFKHNFYLEGGVRMLFGSTVKQAVATNVATLAGNSVYGYLGVAIGNDGRQTTIRFQERGILIPVYFGKIFPLFKHLNPNSGIYVEGGIQYIQHRIWIEVPANNVAQLTRDMRKGYDRLALAFNRCGDSAVRWRRVSSIRASGGRGLGAVHSQEYLPPGLHAKSWRGAQDAGYSGAPVTYAGQRD